MQVFTELAPNQQEAIGKPCRKCKATNTVRKRYGRYGPWVQCDACGDKVYRPRGRSFPQGSQGSLPLQTPIVSVTPTNEQVEQAISKLLKPDVERELVKLQAQRDENGKALSAVASELAKLKASKPVIIEVQQAKGNPVVIEGAHFLFARLVKLVRAGLNLYLWGPAGSGKTTAALQVATSLKLQAEIDTLDPTTFRSMVQGYMTPTGEPVHTTFSRCWTEGKIYVADETDNAPGHVQTLFNSALANGHAPLAWGNVQRAPGFGFIGTGNTPGRPTREFPDRRPMSAAFADRLYFIHWPLDPAIECRAAGLPIPARSELTSATVTPQEWVAWVRKVREWAKVEMPTLQVTPRASLIGLQALALGEHPQDVADALVFRGADDEMRGKALKAVRLV